MWLKLPSKRTAETNPYPITIAQGG